jgi:hypothetical protein
MIPSGSTPSTKSSTPWHAPTHRPSHRLHGTLSHIDQFIDSTARCVLLSFLDCYSGYNQIAIKEEFRIKSTFITPFGAYAYTTMSFGLKNAGAMYQRAIQLCFTDQLHHNVEAYMDDMVVKT